MASIVDVVPATKDDVPAMASILQLAMRVDLMSELLFPGQIYGFQKYNDWSVASFKQAFEESSSKYFKAIDKSTGSILAFASVQYYEDDWNTDVNSITSDNTPKLTQVALPEGMNVKFGELLFGGMSAKKKQHLGGKKHAVWQSLHVLPEFQRQGIGSELLRYGLKVLNLDELPVWLGTQMRGRNLYLKHGWQDVDKFDIDLSEIAGPYMGYGLHRSPCMIRFPPRKAGLFKSNTR